MYCLKKKKKKEKKKKKKKKVLAGNLNLKNVIKPMFRNGM